MSDVTFVAGQAVEQHVPAESQIPTDEREAAKAAVKEAISQAGKDAAKEAKEGKAKDPYRPEGAKSDTPQRGEDGKFVAGEKAEEKAAEEEPVDIDTATVKQLLKARDKIAKQKASVKDELAKERAQLEEQKSSMRDFYRQIEADKVAVARERAQLAALRKDPARAIREQGWDPEELILHLAKDGTPEGAMERQAREMREQLAELKAWKESEGKRETERQEQAQYRQLVQYRDHVEKQFLGHAMDAEKYPHLSEFYGGREAILLSEGDLVAQEYRKLSGGKEASLEQIADYIEEELAERANRWYSKKYGKGSDKVTAPTTKTQKGTKGKSLSPELASERKSLGKELRDLDGDERLAAAREAVGIALAHARDTES